MVAWARGDRMRISTLHSYAAIKNYQNITKACIIAFEIGWFGLIFGHGLEFSTTFPKFFIGHIDIFGEIEPPNSSLIAYIYMNTIRCLWKDITKTLFSQSVLPTWCPSLFTRERGDPIRFLILHTPNAKTFLRNTRKAWMISIWKRYFGSIFGPP